MLSPRLSDFVFPPLTGDDERDRIVRALNPGLWILFFGSIIAILLVHIIQPIRPTILAVLAVYLLSLLPLRHLMIRGHVRTASGLAIAGLWIILSVGLLTDGIRSPAVASFIPIVIIGAATLGSRAALVLTGAASLFVLCILKAEELGWIQTDDVIIADQSYAIVGVFQLFVAGVLVSALIRERDRSYRKIYSYINNAPDGLMSVDEHGIILSANPVMCEIVGLTKAEILGRDIDTLPSMDTFSAKLAFQAVARLASAIETDEGPMEISAARPDGTKFWAECKARAIELENGSVGALLIVRDVTRRREAEHQLLKHRRMDSINRLAAGIAHDFNYLLMTILATAELLRTVDAGRQHRIDVDSIIDACERGGGLTRQLLLFGSAESTPAGDFDLGEVVRDLRRLLSSMVDERVTLRIDADPMAFVRCNRSQLEQIVMNLVINAKDAIEETGSIELSVRIVRAADPEVNRIVLSVTDDGCGMSPKTQAQAFEPFFSTKGREGTGLGLAVVQEIVVQLGGQITVASEPERGTTVTIEFPAAGEARLLAGSPVEGTEPSLGGETILLAEDDDSVRTAVMRLLKAAGYVVLASATPNEAVAVSDLYRGKIDLLLSDVIMPLASGPDLAVKLLSKRPEMKVLFISGYTDDTIKSNLDGNSVAPLLYKPFTKNAILTRVREVIDS